MKTTGSKRKGLVPMGALLLLIMAAGPVAGSTADADSTQILLVHGEALSGTGMNPIVYGVELRITNLRTGVEVVAMIGGAGPGRYEGVFFDAAAPAAAAGDTIHMSFFDPSVAFLDHRQVLLPDDVMAGLVRIDVWVAGVSATPGPPDFLDRVRVTPNPFNPRTWITFELAEPTQVRVDVIDLRGRRVRTLAAGVLEGSQRLVWQGRDEQGGDAPSGVYLFRVTTPDRTVVSKALLLR